MCVHAHTYTPVHVCMRAHVCVCTCIYGGRGLPWGAWGLQEHPRHSPARPPIWEATPVAVTPGACLGCRIFLLTTFSLLFPPLWTTRPLLLAGTARLPGKFCPGCEGPELGEVWGGGGGLTREMLGPAGERHRAGPRGIARPHSSCPSPSPGSEPVCTEGPLPMTPVLGRAALSSPNPVPLSTAPAGR